MRLLLNWSKKEQPYLGMIQHVAKQLCFEVIGTSSVLSIGQLMNMAEVAKCKGVFMVNEETLANLVPGSSPTLDEWRGSKLDYSIPIIVGDSLANLATVPYAKMVAEQDLGKFRTLQPAVPFNYTVLETPELQREAEESLSHADLIAYDIETKTINKDEANLKAGDTIITCCSWTGVFPDGSLKTYVLPFVDFLVDHWLLDSQYAAAIQLMQRINKLPVPKVMHNGMYDSTHSIIYNAEPYNWVLDTMAMWHATYSELPKTLDFVASLTLHDYYQWKPEAKAASGSKDIARYWAYNAKDTWTTARICLVLLRTLPAYARKNYQSQFKLVYPSLYCNFVGIKIDQEKRKELRLAEETRVQGSLVTLRTLLADPGYNPGSPKQTATYIYDVLGGADPKIGTKKNSDGKKVKKIRATDEKNLLSVGNQHPILLRVVKAIVSYREASKAISTYMDFLQKNGRLLYALNPFGAETGRMACQSSSLWCGTQVQNIPPYAKPMLVADEGFIMAEIDNSQSEARCTAYLAQDWVLAAALEDPNKDFYTSLGTVFFNIPYEEVTLDFRNNVLKKIVHGTNYMMGAKTFVENVGAETLLEAADRLGVHLAMTPQSLQEFAQSLLEAYHVPFNKVRVWYQEVKNEIVATKTLTSPLGHVRWFFGDMLKSHMAFNSAVAHAPQNLSVSILNIGLWKVWKLVKESNGDLVLLGQVHDSVLFQYRKGREDLKDKVVDAMQNTVSVNGRVLRIPTVLKQGNSWGTMKK